MRGAKSRRNSLLAGFDSHVAKPVEPLESIDTERKISHLQRVTAPLHPNQTWAPLVYELAREARDLAKAHGLAGRVVLRRLGDGATAIALILPATELVSSRSMGDTARRVRCLELVFDGPPWARNAHGAAMGPRLLGVELEGRRVRTGEWFQREGAWVLRLPI